MGMLTSSQFLFGVVAGVIAVYLYSWIRSMMAAKAGAGA